MTDPISKSPIPNIKPDQVSKSPVPDAIPNLTEITAQPVSKSPVPDLKTKNMNFGEAMSEVVIGRKVHKLEWKDRNYYGFLNGDILSLHKPDNKNYQWVLNLGDLTGTDYIVI